MSGDERRPDGYYQELHAGYRVAAYRVRERWRYLAWHRSTLLGAADSPEEAAQLAAAHRADG